MATPAELARQGVIEEIGGGLEPAESQVRWLYGFPHVIDWLRDTLPGLSPTLDEGRQSPIEQVDDMFHDFVSGDDFSYYERSHSMLPEDRGVWELKTSDVRFFGWFHTKGVFIIAEANDAATIKEYELYRGYLNMALHRRGQIALDLPKFITGNYDDVL
jgi:hypothetical protein